MATLYPPSCTAASAALDYVLRALGADHIANRQIFPGLPEGLQVVASDVVLIATGAPAPLFREAAGRLAAAAHLDVALLRIDNAAEEGICTSVDLVLATLPHAPWAMPNLAVWAGLAGQLWLVPPGFGASVEVTSEGFLLDLIPPYTTLTDREIGVGRAARAMRHGLAREAR